MTSTLEIFPLPVLILDYTLGMVMWTLLGRAVLDLFVSANSGMVIVLTFRQVTNPVIRIFNKVTPRFLVAFLVPVYVAWWFYMIRFYVLPLIFFNELGMLSFPLESSIALFLKGLVN